MREAIAQKSIHLSLQDEEIPSTVDSPPTNSKKTKPTLEKLPPKANSNSFHLYVKKELPNSNSYSNQNTQDSAHGSIQNAWSSFTGMSDSQRNQMLKGLITRCSSKQIEYICTLLNLKSVEESQNNHIIPSDIAFKFPDKKITKAFHNLNSKPVIQPIHSKESNSPKSKAAESADVVDSLSPNIYVKLLNSKFDTKLILKQILKSGPAVTSFAMDFLSSRCKKLQTIIECMSKLAAETDVSESLKLLLNCIVQSTDCAHASIYFHEVKSKKFIVKSSTWQIEESIIAFENIFASSPLLKRETINVYNVKSSDYYTVDVEHYFDKQIDAECVISTAIPGEGTRVSGLIEVINKKNGPPFFNAEDEFFINALACLGTLMFSHANVKENELKKTDDLKMFLNTASMMSSNALDMGDLINVIMTTAQDLVCAERCAMFLIDRDREELWSRLARGSAEIRFPMRLGIAGHVAMTGEILNIPDAYADDRFNRSVDIKTGYKTRNILCMPMKNAKNEIIGVTQVINKIPETAFFNKDDEAQLLSFSSLSAASIEKQQMFKSLQDSLEITSKAKLLYEKCIYTSSLVIMMINSNGKLEFISRPELLEITPEKLKLFKNTSFKSWIGVQNDTLIQNITQAFNSEKLISEKCYIFYFEGKEWYINYGVSLLHGEEKDELSPGCVALYIEIIDTSIEIHERDLRQKTIRDTVSSPESEELIFVSSTSLHR